MTENKTIAMKLMKRKNLFPALILASLGAFMIGWSIFITLTSLDTGNFESVGALVTFYIAGILLIVFAVHYARTGGMSDLDWTDEPEDLGIEWEFDEDDGGDLGGDDDGGFDAPGNLENESDESERK